MLGVLCDAGWDLFLVVVAVALVFVEIVAAVDVVILAVVPLAVLVFVDVVFGAGFDPSADTVSVTELGQIIIGFTGSSTRLMFSDGDIFGNAGLAIEERANFTAKPDKWW